jgi:hypothetical protein
VARRATYLLDVAHRNASTITVAGPYEFTHRAGDLPTVDFLTAMRTAFVSMDYDVGFLSDRERKAFAARDLSLPKGWFTHDAPSIYRISLPEGKIAALVFVPALPQHADTVGIDMKKKVANLFSQARTQANIVIAVSDWGIKPERDYLAGIGNDPCPDIFLGSGRGGGIVGQVLADGRVYYVRPYEKGKAVTCISVLSWPAKNDEFKWIRKKNITSELVVLDDGFSESLIINQIFSKVDVSNN